MSYDIDEMWSVYTQLVLREVPVSYEKRFMTEDGSWLPVGGRV